MDGTQTLNLNSAECLKEMVHWGMNKVHNVCSGTVVEVPWGALDYIGYIGLSALISGFSMAVFGGAVFFLLWLWIEIRS